MPKKGNARDTVIQTQIDQPNGCQHRGSQVLRVFLQFLLAMALSLPLHLWIWTTTLRRIPDIMAVKEG
jgi:hypothetical protein